MTKVSRDNILRVSVGEGIRKIESSSIEANLLFLILEKLEEIRIGIADIENASEGIKRVG